MRVLQVVQELRRGGAETVVHTLVTALAGRGVHTEVAAAPGPWSDAFDAVRVHPLPLVEQRPGRLLSGTVALHRAVRSARPDVVHCHNPTMALLAALPTWRGRRPADAGDRPRRRGRPYRSAARLLRWAGPEVVACGPAVRQALSEAGSAVHRTVLNGVRPAAPALSRIGLRRELGLDPTAEVVASVGRLVPLKRHDLAVRAVARLPGVTLLVVGAGPERDALAGLARSLGVADRVVLTGLRDDVSALLGALDAVLLCSRGEGLPLTLLEALAARVPVVTTDVPGVRELVSESGAALVCAPTAESLAAGVRRVLDDTGLAARLVGAGLEAVGPYSEHRMVEGYLDLYRRLAEGIPA